MLKLYLWLHTLEGFASAQAELSALISTSDVIFFEHAYSPSKDELDKLEAAFNSVSKGKETPDQARVRLFFQEKWHFILPKLTERLLKMIHGQHKKVYLERSPLDSEHAFPDSLSTLTLSSDSKLDDALREYEKNLREIAKDQAKRDESLALQLAKICEDNSTSDILALIGKAHQRGLTRFLRIKGVESSSDESHEELLPTESELVSRMEVEEEPTKREMLRSLCELVEIRKVRGIDLENAKLTDLTSVRDLFAKMSDDEVNTWLRRQVWP